MSLFNTEAIFEMVVRAIVLFTALPVHECAHALVAYKLGDPTARNLGRLTLNPFVHLDLVGSVLLLFTGFGWAKPVPIATRNFKHIKRDMALSALAGPVSNILMALVAMLLLKSVLLLGAVGSAAVEYTAALTALSSIMYIVVSINVGLAVFNLLPIPPLDGSRLLTALLPVRAYNAVMKYERVIMGILFLGLFTGILSLPLRMFSNLMLSGLDILTGFMGGRLWG